MAIAIDTHAAIQDLKAAGADPKLAEAIVKTVSQADAQLATKADLETLRADLRAELAQLEQRVTLRIVAIAAIANGILFAALRYLPPPG